MSRIEMEWLPMGSVVRIKNLDMYVMIMARMQKAEDEDAVFEYAGAPYPTFFVSSSKSILFNGDDIEDLLFIGYRNEAELEWCKELTKAKEELAKDSN